MIRRRCPVCTSTLAEMKTGNVTALGCRECRGMWFDLKALEEAAGEQVQLGPLEGASALSCSQCSAPLSPALFPGGIPVEACSTCNGFFLRSGDLGQPVSAISALASEQVAYRERLGSIQTTKGIAELIFRAPVVAMSLPTWTPSPLRQTGREVDSEAPCGSPSP